MGKAWMVLTYEKLVKLLQLPEETEIIVVEEQRWINDQVPNVKLLVSHPDIHTDYIIPCYITEYDENGNIVDVKFNAWN